MWLNRREAFGGLLEWAGFADRPGVTAYASRTIAAFVGREVDRLETVAEFGCLTGMSEPWRAA